MAADGLHISISAEKVTEFAGVTVTNSMITSLIVSGFLIATAVFIRSKLEKTNSPKGIQNIAELIIEKLDNLIQSVTNDRTKTRSFFPLIATFFLFILVNNWFGLLPGVGTIGYIEHHEDNSHAAVERATDTLALPTFLQANAATEQDTTGTDTGVLDENIDADDIDIGTEAEEGTFVPYFRPGTADLNGTLALGIISVLATQFFGVHFIGLGYFKKFINFADPISFFVGILEAVSECAKIISFAFRLFGNIFAGEVLLVVTTYLAKLVVPMPFYGLEVFVGFIQALVFMMLSLVFFNMATEEHAH